MATNIEDSRTRKKFEQNGWRLTSPLQMSVDYWLYRDYIQRSKGEFTVAKDQYVRLDTGWFSDRSACYLAAGRPVITQETGFTKNYGGERRTAYLFGRWMKSPMPRKASTAIMQNTPAPLGALHAKSSKRKSAQDQFSIEPVSEIKERRLGQD